MWEMLTATALRTPKGEEAVHFWQIANWKLLFVLRQGPGWPRTHSVDQAGLELTKSACLCLPSARIQGMRHHARLFSLFLFRCMSVLSDSPGTGVKDHS